MTATVGRVCLKHHESTVLEGLDIRFESELWRRKWEGRKRGRWER